MAGGVARRAAVQAAHGIPFSKNHGVRARERLENFAAFPKSAAKPLNNRQAKSRWISAAAEHVRLLEDCYEPFTQRKWSSRGSDRFELQGVIGGGVYGDVPQSLLPWLAWGGNLHVGTHRVAGAGGWRIVLD